LAQTRLTENAKKGIRSLIGDASLASIANWAGVHDKKVMSHAALCSVLRSQKS
jgi:hypothetical protein